jgi:20S proteasome alpha/beta subunit
MKLCGNYVPLRYDALVCGFELTPIRTGLEQRVADLETENAELRRAIDLVANAFRNK